MLECPQLAAINVAGNLGQGCKRTSSQPDSTIATKNGELSASTSRSEIGPGLWGRGPGNGSNGTLNDSASAVGTFLLEDWRAVQRMTLRIGWPTELRGLGAAFLTVDQSPTLFILDDGRHLSKRLFRCRNLETTMASGSRMPGRRHSAASISVYFVVLDPGEGVATAPVRDSALVGLLSAVRLVLTRTSACDVHAVLASARSRQISGSSGRGVGHAVLGVPPPGGMVLLLGAADVSQWNGASRALEASRSSVDQRRAVNVLAGGRMSATGLGCAGESLPSLGPRAECFSHPSRIMAGDGLASFQREEQHTWQLFTFLQYILWISLLIRVFLDNFFTLRSCFADQRTQKPHAGKQRALRGGPPALRWQASKRWLDRPLPRPMGGCPNGAEEQGTQGVVWIGGRDWLQTQCALAYGPWTLRGRATIGRRRQERMKTWFLSGRTKLG